MATPFHELTGYGWSNFFQSQLTEDEFAATVPVRVTAAHRNRMEVVAHAFHESIPPFTNGDDVAATIGDWLLLESDTLAPIRLLDRKSLFRRKAAGSAQRMQPIAANVDTLLIVTSCNEDFSPARLERYLALAREAGVMPVVVLTKADLVDDARPFVIETMKLMPALHVECLDAREPSSAEALRPWCAIGQTVALAGSSGVGKSTLVNTLLGGDVQATGAIREDDAKGRQTTSGRSMHRLEAGGWLIDSPGMRELQLAEAAEGVEQVFAEIAELARECRFRDCLHEREPGCAVRGAVENGTLDPARFKRYRKLRAEDLRNSEAVHERRARERGFGRMVKSIAQRKQRGLDHES
jgi:ribosome biogenesis GTPase / thiamine phosphate phosphatase